MTLFKSVCIFILFFTTKLWGSFAVEDCALRSTSFRKTGNNSKYVYNPIANVMPFGEVEKFCATEGLEVAVIQSSSDYKHLKKFITSEKLTGRNWALGLKDDRKEGMFEEPGGIPIQYSAFWFNEPSNGNGGSNCVEFKMTSTGHFAMFDVPCSSKVFPLCQYKSSKCYMKSPQTAKTKSEVDEMKPLGVTSERKYYFSTKQKNWDDAMKFCSSQHQKLLDFVNDNQIKSVHTFTNAYLNIASDELHPASGIWTSGKFLIDFPMGNNFRWESLSKSFQEFNISNSSWSWSKGEPKDRSFDHLETCVSFYSPSNAGDVLKFSASNCFIPLYFICYEDKRVEAKGRSLTNPALKNNPNSLINAKKNCIVDGPPKVNLTEPGFINSEILTLMEYNLKNKLDSNNIQIKVPLRLKWRQSIIEIFSEITKKLCPEVYVNSKFINLMKNMMIIYYNSVEWSNTIDEWRWDTYLNDLVGCSKKIKPLDLQGNAFAILSFTPDNKTGPIPIHIPTESIDTDTPLPDLIIDSFWFMFMTSTGVCYRTLTNKRLLNWITDYFYRFTQDFLSDFFLRWQFAGPINYGAFLGDIDISEQIYNLRACSVASYESSGIFNMYFARPLYLASGDNFKTGQQLTSINYDR